MRFSSATVTHAYRLDFQTGVEMYRTRHSFAQGGDTILKIVPTHMSVTDKLRCNKYFGSTTTVHYNKDPYSAGSPDWTEQYREYKTLSLYGRFGVSGFVIA